jgi:hypothetical protein
VVWVCRGRVVGILVIVVFVFRICGQIACFGPLLLLCLGRFFASFSCGSTFLAGQGAGLVWAAIIFIARLFLRGVFVRIFF